MMCLLDQDLFNPLKGFDDTKYLKNNSVFMNNLSIGSDYEHLKRSL